MVQRKQTKRPKPEEASPVKHRRVQDRQPEYDQAKAHDEDIARQAGASLESQAALLARAQSDEQRGRLLTHLQQTRGNAYVQRLIGSPVIQAKLTVSSPGDTYEREADRVAETVQRQEEDELQTEPTAVLQRQPEKDEDEQEAAMARPAADLQRQPEQDEDETSLYPKAAGDQTQTASDSVETQIDDERGGGQPLDGAVRQSLEARLGHDFSQVRVHTDTKADHLSRKLGAEAFTTGHDVFFREGAYQPQTGSGKGLIAHELTHVVQQQAAPSLQRQATAEATTTQAPAAETGATSTQATALKALWDATVTNPVREAHDILSGSGSRRSRASQAIQLLNRSKEAIYSIMPSYRKKAETYGMMSWIGSRFETIITGLKVYTGERESFGLLRDLLGPEASAFTILGKIRDRL